MNIPTFPSHNGILGNLLDRDRIDSLVHEGHLVLCNEEVSWLLWSWWLWLLLLLLLLLEWEDTQVFCFHNTTFSSQQSTAPESNSCEGQDTQAFCFHNTIFSSRGSIAPESNNLVLAVEVEWEGHNMPRWNAKDWTTRIFLI